MYVAVWKKRKTSCLAREKMHAGSYYLEVICGGRRKLNEKGEVHERSGIYD